MTDLAGSTGAGSAGVGSAGRVARVELLAVPGLPEVTPGADLAALILEALAGAGLKLRSGDLLAVASKVVAKAEGRYLEPDAPDRDTLDHEAAVAAETVRVVAERRTPRGIARIVRSRSGPVLAAAGVDASNLPPVTGHTGHTGVIGATDGAGRFLALPADPDASARRLRAALRAAGAPSDGVVGVVVTDTLGRPWRVGQTDTAIGAAGLLVAQDLTGRPDTYGRVMEVTVRALADEIASAADLVKGKTDGVPVALVRGLGQLVTADDGPGAAALLRTEAEDWFRYGHAEAVRAALGLTPEAADAVTLPVQPVAPGTVGERLQRAVTVAMAGPDALSLNSPSVTLETASDGEFNDAVSVRPGDPTPPAWLATGVLAQRIVVAAWAEDLVVAVIGPADDGTLRLSARPG